MEFRFKQCADDIRRCVPESFYQGAQGRHFDAEEDVARTILSRRGFEKTLRYERRCGVGDAAQMFLNQIQRDHWISIRAYCHTPLPELVS